MVMEEQTQTYTPPAKRGRGGLLKWVVIIIIIIALVWYFAPDILLNAIDFVKLTFGI